MNAPGDFKLYSLGSTDLPSPNAKSNSSFLQGLGAELVCTQDASGKYLCFYWQKAAHYDLTSEKVVGRRLSETFCPVATDAYLDTIERILEERCPERYSCSFVYSGQSFLFELVISPVLQADGTAKTVLVMGHQLQASAPVIRNSVLPSSSDYYHQQLCQIGQDIRGTLDLDTIWQKTVTGLGEALDLSRCLICSYEPSSLKVEVVAEYCQKPFVSMLGQELDLADDPALAQALSSVDPVAVERVPPNLFQQQSVLVVATCYQDQPNGLISLQQCDSASADLSVRRRRWSDAEIDMVKSLAAHVGTAIAHAKLYKELLEARTIAEESCRLKSEFLANTSHELRTPLNGMIGSLKLILDGTVDEPDEQLEFIDDAYRSAIYLLNIINDILDIAKIEAGKMELELGAVKLDDLFNELENFILTQAEQKKLSFRIERPATHDEVILYGNYQRLLQVMLNLVGNAIKFTHEGGVTISAEIIKKKVNFNNQELPGRVRLRVEDTGIGVSLEKQHRLFQSFSQVDGSRTRQYEGTGLGLAISQKLVETMGGGVKFFSMGEGLGSTVTFTVPLYQEPVMISMQ